MHVPRPLAWLVALIACLAVSPLEAQTACPSGTLVIGTDATFPPFSSKVGDEFVGFEIDMGGAIAAQLGCRARWINSSFDGIFPAMLAGKYDLVIASVTITPERRKSMLFSDPYIDAGQAIAIRRGTPKLTGLDALKGKKVGVGLNTTGQYILEPVPEIRVTKYPSVDLALADLHNGRLDAAVGDRPVFRYMIRNSFPDLELMSSSLNSEQWGIALAPDRQALRQQVNAALAKLRADGMMARLEAKYLGKRDTAPTGDAGTTETSAAAPGATGSAAPAATGDGVAAGATSGVKTGGGGAAPQGPRFRPDRFLESIPIFLKGARWTLVLSLSSFLAALPLGLLIALGRMSRLAMLRAPAAVYVEVLRGTPLLVQIFFIYFVLPAFGLSLSDLTTGIVALSVNASAYISEIFRAGLLSLEAGQGEAAEALGMTRAQALRYVLVPQAIRRVVPPLTNEGIALIKESSLVSIMGMTELTRTGQELASRYADPLTIWPGVALTYFVMTFPLTRLASYLERRLQAGQRRAA
jgi:His/Glu/Gln/Arg/opine family amino acid ABC transporter permease subunit